MRLVAGEIEASAVDGGWQRRDALQWLFMDVSHASLDSILDELAAAAEVSDRAVGERQETVGNGDCTVAVQVSAHAFSEAAKSKIAAAGGSVTEL